MGPKGLSYTIHDSN